jgi:hypothetical protein
LSGAGNATGFDHIFQSIDESSRTSNTLKEVVVLNLKLQKNSTSLSSLLQLITQGGLANNLNRENLLSGVVINDSYTSNPFETLNHFYTLVAGCIAREQTTPDKPLSKFIISAYGLQEIYRGRDGFTWGTTDCRGEIDMYSAGSYLCMVETNSALPGALRESFLPKIAERFALKFPHLILN